GRKGKGAWGLGSPGKTQSAAWPTARFAQSAVARLSQHAISTPRSASRRRIQSGILRCLRLFAPARLWRADARVSRPAAGGWRRDVPSGLRGRDSRQPRPTHAHARNRIRLSRRRGLSPPPGREQGYINVILPRKAAARFDAYRNLIPTRTTCDTNSPLHS